MISHRSTKWYGYSRKSFKSNIDTSGSEEVDTNGQPSDNLGIMVHTELMIDAEMMIAGELRYRQTLESNADIQDNKNPMNQGIDGGNLW